MEKGNFPTDLQLDEERAEEEIVIPANPLATSNTEDAVRELPLPPSLTTRLPAIAGERYGESGYTVRSYIYIVIIIIFLFFPPQ